MRLSLQDSPFPLFDEVKAEHVVPGITQLLDEVNAELDELEKKVQPTWTGLVEPIERLTDRLSLAWGTVSHLKVTILSAQSAAVSVAHIWHLYVRSPKRPHP